MLNPKTLGDGIYTFGDGLRLKVRGNSKLWILRVQVCGKTKERSLGSWPALSTAGAREKAAAVRAKLKTGDTGDTEKPKDAAPMLSEVWAEAVENRRQVKVWTNEKATEQWANTIKTYILPGLGDFPVDQIARDDVLEVLRPLWGEKPATANKVRGRLEAVLSYCKANGWRDGENPAAWKGNLELFLPPLSAAGVKHFGAIDFETLRDKVLPALWERRTSASCAVIFGCLTALRAGEFLRARWLEINGNIFTVPWERMKTAKHSREDFRVPLSRQALEVLDAVRGMDETVVFPGRIAKFNAIDTPRITIQRLTNTTATMHGMRSVFRDWCAREGVNFDVAEKCLSHTIGDRTVRAYFRDDLLEQRAAVMQAWADAIFPKTNSTN